jgi:acyl dehydratase
MTAGGRGAVVLGRPGAWTEAFEVEVSAEDCRAYAAATSETDPRLLAGEVAAPMFATVLVRPAVRAAFDLAMPEGLPPSVPRLAGEQDMRFHQPIRPGTRVRSRARFLAISPKSSGTVLAYQIEVHARDGALLNEQFMKTFLPGVRWPDEVGEPPASPAVPPAAGRPPALARVRQRLDPDQTFRYAAASGDPSRWHLDDAVARAAGLPGIIVHGLCTMAFLGRAVAGEVAAGDALRLRRLAVRFSRPIVPGDDLVTELWEGGVVDGRHRYYCEAKRSDGQTVLTNGVADVDPAA